MSGCTNRNIQILLPWYVKKTLSKKETRQVTEHLEECLECSRRVRKLEWLSVNIQEYREKWRSNHVSSDLLVIYAESKHEIKGIERKKIEDHLSACESCKKELNILQNINRELQSDFRTPFLERIDQELYKILKKIVLRPQLVGVIVILLLLYPAWHGLFKTEKDFRNIQQPQMIQAIYELDPFDQRTEETGKNVIQLPSDITMFSLYYTIPILSRETIRYDVSIENEDGQIIWNEQDIKSIDSYGRMMLNCYSLYFSKGSYQLIVEEVNILDKKVEGEFIFPFEIMK